MHRTLKREATRPPKANLRAQQRHFNHFRRTFNSIRPHEALDDATPDSVYRSALRAYPDVLPPIEYPEHFEVRKVSTNGGIRWHARWINISSALGNEFIGLEPIGPALWQIYFGPTTLGWFDEELFVIFDTTATQDVTQSVNHQLAPLCQPSGALFIRSTVRLVAKRLDGAVEALRSAPIEGPHPYLYLDATFLDARWARKVENVSALVAYAVDPDGHRRLLAITLGPEESEDSWSELLEQLLERGLSGVELVIADEHAGLAAAVRRFLPEVRRQRCTVHLQRNVLAKVPHRLRKRVAREVAAVFRAPGLAKAKKRLAEITARWHNELPEAMRVLERGFTAATQFYAFPEPHWARLRTTNSLERLHTEIKRRIRSAGAFLDRASALRLITAVALRTTAVWTERRYLDLSLLEPKELAKAA